MPSGGGAVAGLGETFTPDLSSGAGRFSVPIEVPAGRLGVQPALALRYQTGSGNGPWGLGWDMGLTAVMRKTSRGVPRYDPSDVFILSGTEDLVPVAGSTPGRVRYRPRTEGLFARIEHVRDDSGDYWEVRTRDGLRSRYGEPVADPADPDRIAGWRLTEVRDPMNNVIRYEYLADSGQPLIERISYADYGDPAAPSFLVTVDFDYESRPDPFSTYRSGFEIRTTLRCHTIRVSTHAADGVARTAREYRLDYQQAPFNGVSLLTRVGLVGVDGTAQEPMPPVTFEYSTFDPAGRRFQPLTGPALPPVPLSHPALSMVDLRGVGQPDLVELGSAQRFWRNAGGGRFEAPRPLTEAPPFALGVGTQFMDANGDGRPDLVVSAPASAGGFGYFPMSFGGGWSRNSFQQYRQRPSVDLADPRVRLVDLDGDGLTDVLFSGRVLESWFNDADPDRAWESQAFTGLPTAGGLSDVDFADPRIRMADMTGDGLSDIVLLRSGNVGYWPNLGHGRFGAMITMRTSPRLPDGYDPRRVLLGDLDGDGVADLAYLDQGRVLLWGNRCGNSWTEQPITVVGTPLVDTDAVQLADLHGTGMAGVLFSRADDGSGRAHLRFLDLTAGVKPYLLTGIDNHHGARTAVRYRSSTEEFQRDRSHPVNRWRTTLPFPVHVVAKVEVDDAFSHGRSTAVFRYHHGYWDGLEREFRGFGMVEQIDSETFAESPGTVATEHFSPPTLTKTWFHLGPVAAVEAGDWTELDLSNEYWPGDPSLLSRPAEQTSLLRGLSREARRSALRALRGQVLRSELFALDGTQRADRPYTVTESLPGLREESAGVFYPFVLGQRSTQWERGDDPLTVFSFTAGFDRYGLPTGTLAIALPRGRAADSPTGASYLATFATTQYAQRDDAGHYLVDRVARASSFEVVNDGTASVEQLRRAVLAGEAGRAGASLRLTGHTRTFYDGEAFTGLPLGSLGEQGLPTRVESLAFTGAFLDQLYPSGGGRPRPVYLDPAGPTVWSPEYPAEFRELLPDLAGYRFDGDDAVPGSPGGYYVTTARHRFESRGLVVSTMDALGSVSRIEYDAHDLLPVRAVDAAGLVTEGVFDYRLLKPRAVTNPNGNTTSATFSPLGLVTAVHVRGKHGEGDRDLPSTRMSYDLLAFAERGQPISVRCERRVHHDSDEGAPGDMVSTVDFTDGFGRLLQRRAQAEDTQFGDRIFGGGVIPAVVDVPPVGDTVGRTRAEGDPDNVIVSGSHVYDNKGRIVHSYEPFFGTGFAYAEPAGDQLGQRVTSFYDPRGHTVRTVSPDGSEQRVVFGVPADLTDPDTYAPTPWESYTYDANDNAGRTHGDDTQPYRDHWNTPTSVELDALGRAVVSVARTGGAAGDRLTTRAAYDIQGNLLSITDALGREAFRYTVDLAKRRWRVESIDAGRQDTVPDALGHPVESRDARDVVTLQAFDRLHRLARLWARDDPAEPVTLRQRLDYGDGGDPGQPAAERKAAREANLLGFPARQHDEAGLLTIDAVDFKGNVLSCTRRVIADGPVLAVYEKAPQNGWQVQPFTVDWTPAPGQTQEQRDALLLEPLGYQTNTQYDALNRATSHLFPADVAGQRRELRPTYNRAGELEAVSLDGVTYVQRIAYDATGRRTLVAYGNGVLTRYAYDVRSFRLARLRTEHYTLAGEATYRPGGPVLQDQGYRFDLAGNLLAIEDRTPGSGIPGNPAALTASDPMLRKLLGDGDALDRRFTYDPIYRLRSATGREAQSPPPGDPWTDLPRGGDVTRAQAYTEKYDYDAAGNLLGLDKAGAGGFTRTYTMSATSNRLQQLVSGKTPFAYTFDASGNLIAETTSRHFSWTHVDRLRAFATQTAGAEPSVHAQYLYDAAGQRVKKLVRRQGGAIEVTHYLDGVFEHHRWSGPRGGANNHVHVMDDQQRIALVRSGLPHPDDAGPPIAFHLDDHVGSSTVVLDASGAFVNREEYTPYGETSFGSYSRKRYRFLGRERDEESGLGHHGLRYYLPYLARWASCDPLAPKSGLNAFRYAKSSPMCFADPNGAEDVEVTQIARALQEAANNMESALRRKPNEGASAFGTRLHDIFQRVVEAGSFNFPKMNASRIITEVVISADGVILDFSRKPGGSPKDSVTADIAILKKGLSNTDRLVGRKASDVLAAGVDFKTGKARLQTYQKAFFKAQSVPLYEVRSEGDLAADMKRAAAAPRNSQKGAADLGIMMTLASIGLTVLQFLDDPSARNAAEIAQGLAAQAAMDAVAVRLLGRSIGGPLMFFGGMRSDNAQYNAQMEEQEMRELGERELRFRVMDYRDSRPDVPVAEARRIIIQSILAEHEKRRR
ncbi:hypothetical protein Rhe02_42130 [Rhizocola hellebori]|uniref:Insecticide toxin TcdB middle/N-terminal domain-containing protein n=1 Tax=Rhizocola hellebori TaxID=1392758 RepID=A0A8J3VHK6_9ACTN|nr:hypothetical protein Rhe02_42130 [Rhizocola hellebori]